MNEALAPENRVYEEPDGIKAATTTATATTATAATSSVVKEKSRNVIVHPRLKPMPFKTQDLSPPPTLQPFEVLSLNGVTFHQIEDLPVNRRGFKYKLCRPSPIFKSNHYATTDLPPFEACVSLFDRSTGILFSKDCKTVTTTEGWRSIRANVCIRQGMYFFEFEIVKSDEKSHVRIGLARKEASLEAPVGYDGYGYGLRDVDGELMFTSRRKKVYINGGFRTGDVIGILVELPSLEEQKKGLNRYVDEKKSEMMPVDHKSKKRKTKRKLCNTEDNVKFNEHGNIVRDQIPTKSKGALYYDQFEYTKTKTMDHLLNPVTVFGEKAVIEMDDKTKNIPVIAQSKVRFFKNGVEQASCIENLYSFLPTNIEDNDEMNLEANVKQQQNPNYRNTDDNTLGYYPMMSVFNNGAVTLNAGPNFTFPPSSPMIKPLSDRFDEQVVEEWFWDVLDEVEAQYLDSFDDTS
ncbi:ASH2 [Candida oxycetoniae]|uniref:ASH2 n=1 Tax=Candida oxycetoniae TaxID=497107 RepID=A0AAI9SXS8_9ASCO|nr:ASH2 [Candida oxycetoniae]KAI3404760.2 ASH2 [Candida oxycetoniae]